MEDYNVSENEEPISDSYENKFDEISEEVIFECSSCGSSENVKIETLRKTEALKVKNFEIFVCVKCGNIYTDPKKLFENL